MEIALKKMLALHHLEHKTSFSCHLLAMSEAMFQ